MSTPHPETLAVALPPRNRTRSDGNRHRNSHQRTPDFFTTRRRRLSGYSSHATLNEQHIEQSELRDGR